MELPAADSIKQHNVYRVRTNGMTMTMTMTMK